MQETVESNFSSREIVIGVVSLVAMGIGGILAWRFIANQANQYEEKIKTLETTHATNTQKLQSELETTKQQALGALQTKHDDELKERQQIIDEQQKEISNLSVGNEKLKAEIQEQTRSIDQKVKAAKDAQAADYQKLLVAKNLEIQQQKQQISALDKKVQSLETENTLHKQNLDALNHTNTEQAQKVSLLETENSKLRQENQKKEASKVVSFNQPPENPPSRERLLVTFGSDVVIDSVPKVQNPVVEQNPAAYNQIFQTPTPTATPERAVVGANSSNSSPHTSNEAASDKATLYLNQEKYDLAIKLANKSKETGLNGNETFVIKCLIFLLLRYKNQKTISQIFNDVSQLLTKKGMDVTNHCPNLFEIFSENLEKMDKFDVKELTLTEVTCYCSQVGGGAKLLLQDGTASNFFGDRAKEMQGKPISGTKTDEETYINNFLGKLRPYTGQTHGPR